MHPPPSHQPHLSNPNWLSLQNFTKLVNKNIIKPLYTLHTIWQKAHGPSPWTYALTACPRNFYFLFDCNAEESKWYQILFQIEELPTNESFAGKSSFSSYSSSSASSDYLRYSDPTNSNSNFGAKFERPTELDLFGSGSRKQQGYIFNK